MKYTVCADAERARFTALLGATATVSRPQKILWAAALPTPLGLMIAVSDAQGLYLLEFLDRCHLEIRLANLQAALQAAIVQGETPVSAMLGSELDLYFEGRRRAFQTPLHFQGSAFQKAAWNVLLQVPYGTMWTYQTQAAVMGRPTAYRAVANANGANAFCIIVPCHRVGRSDGDLGGYAAGRARKKWLVEHERSDQH